MSSSYHMEQKISKQVVPITYTLEKRFVAAATCERVQENVAYFGLCKSSLHF